MALRIGSKVYYARHHGHVSAVAYAAIIGMDWHILNLDRSGIINANGNDTESFATPQIIIHCNG